VGRYVGPWPGPPLGLKRARILVVENVPVPTRAREGRTRIPTKHAPRAWLTYVNEFASGPEDGRGRPIGRRPQAVPPEARGDRIPPVEKERKSSTPGAEHPKPPMVGQLEGWGQGLGQDRGDRELLPRSTKLMWRGAMTSILK